MKPDRYTDTALIYTAFVLGILVGVFSFAIAWLPSTPEFEAGRFQGWRDCVRTHAREKHQCDCGD